MTIDTNWKEKYLNKVTCGDCLELMKELPDKCIDLVLTDPPYTIHAKSGGGLHKKRGWLKNVHEAGIDEFSPTDFLVEYERICKTMHAYIFCAKGNLLDYLGFISSKGWNYEILIYGKENPVPTKNNKYLSDKEYCLFIRDKKCFFNNDLKFEKYKTIQTVNVVPSQWGHPTEKNLEYIKDRILFSSREKDIILDPFLGSGTTARAAKDLGRNFVGFEISPEYCEIARKRLLQQNLF